MATVAVLLNNGDFVVPPFERILPGTTAIKIMDDIENEVLGRDSSHLIDEGYIK